MAIKLKITSGDYSIEGTSATIKCNGKKLAEDLVIECVEVADVALISFTISGTTYYSPEGWTWERWVTDTTYSKGDFKHDSGGYIVQSFGAGIVAAKGSGYVKPTDEINANQAYIISQGGGAD